MNCGASPHCCQWQQRRCTSGTEPQPALPCPLGKRHAPQNVAVRCLIPWGAHASCGSGQLLGAFQVTCLEAQLGQQAARGMLCRRRAALHGPAQPLGHGPRQVVASATQQRLRGRGDCSWRLVASLCQGEAQSSMSSAERLLLAPPGRCSSSLYRFISAQTAAASSLPVQLAPQQCGTNEPLGDPFWMPMTISGIEAWRGSPTHSPPCLPGRLVVQAAEAERKQTPPDASRTMRMMFTSLDAANTASATASPPPLLC